MTHLVRWEKKWVDPPAEVGEQNGLTHLVWWKKKSVDPPAEVGEQNGLAPPGVVEEKIA